MTPKKPRTPAAKAAAPKAAPVKALRALKAAAPTRFRAEHDAVEGSSGSRGTGNKRRQARVDNAEETGRLSNQLPPYKRLLALALCRDAARNYSTAKSILRQLRLNVVGWKYEVAIAGEDAREAQTWHNTVWAENADFRDGLHLAELWGLLFDSVIRDGDMGVLFDDNLTGSGRLAFWEADQMCDPPATDPIMAAHPKWTSQDGVIRDELGRIVGFCVSNLRGLTQAQPGEYHIFPRDPLNEDNNDFRLVRMPWRMNQGRGIPEMLVSVADLLDSYEMRAKELQSAKKQAGMAAIVEREEATEEFDDERLDPNYEGNENDPAAEGTLPEKAEPENYDVLEKLTGGATEYIVKGDKVTFPDIGRPNVHMPEFIDHVVKAAGSSFGMARCYATMQADSSYTAFRGEMVLTWVMFVYFQNWFDQIRAWAARRAIRFGLRTAAIKQAPAAGWEHRMKFPHPTMPQVDGTREQDALTKAIKNGKIDLTEIFGPDWKAQVDLLAEQLDYIREKIPSFSAFEQKSGGQAPGGEEDPDPNDPGRDLEDGKTAPPAPTTKDE